MHVPKCGGTSVQTILKRWFGVRYIRPSHEGFCSLEGDPRIKNGCSCIHEHFDSYQRHLERVWPREPKQIFTILRDPFDMLVSMYFYGLQGERETLAKSTGSLNAFLDEMHSRRGTASLFTWLVPRHRQETLHDYAENFMFVGTTDYLDWSMKYLAELLGQPKYDISQLNMSEHVGHVPDRRDEFRNLLADEYEFYDRARVAVENERPLGWGMRRIEFDASHGTR